MKKHVSVLLLVAVSLMLWMVGCATTKQMDTAEKLLGIQGVDLKNTREELAREKGFREGLGKRIDGIENNFKAELGATKKDLTSVVQRVEKTEVGLNEVKTDLGATKNQIQGLEAEFRAGQKEYKNLKDFALARLQWLKKIVSLREARQGNPELEKFDVFFVGSFPTGKSALTEKLEAQLEKVVSAVSKLQKKEVEEIDAFASTSGSVDRNQVLSDERGKTIREFLKAKGIEVHEDKVFGRGATVHFGESLLDNQCAIIFVAKPEPAAAPAVPAPAPTKP